MERVTSRKNRIIEHFRALAADGKYRLQANEYVCDGEKTLREALSSGAEVKKVLWADGRAFYIPEAIEQYSCPPDLINSVSTLKNSPGPVFSVKIPETPREADNISSAIILENVQDPGNVGTVIRTADAMGTGAVILVGSCADPYGPKTVRATMGGIFRQRVLVLGLDELQHYVNRLGLQLYAAALSDDAENIRNMDLKNSAVAIGNEGSGLSDELLSACAGRIVIPMRPECESLNAAVAASIVMWEMSGQK